MSNARKAGVIEKYLRLSDSNQLFDIEFKEGIQVGGKHLQLFALSNAEDLPALCGSRINYDKYSTDKTKFSVGFASTIGQLLSCNHIYNQFVFVEVSQDMGLLYSKF